MKLAVLDAANTVLFVGDAVVFMNLVDCDSYSANSMGTGVIDGFTPKMVRIKTSKGTIIHRLAGKIAKTFTQKLPAS